MQKSLLSEVNLENISIGCVVKVYDVEFEEEMEFKLVIPLRPTAFRTRSPTNLLWAMR